MRRMAFTIAALVCTLAVTDGALAQGRRSTAAPRSHGDTDDNLPPSVPPPISTLPPTRGISGPRLEPGAVVCRSEEDLQHRAQVSQRRADGVPDAGNPLEGCHLLEQQRGVEIVDRHGLGRTEVKVKPSGETGWTDAFVR
jgi:hypothetical protein